MSDRLTVLTSKSVFTGTGDLPFEGFVAVRGNRIEAVGAKCEAASYLTQADEVVDLGDRTIMPGLIDVHTFYTGWALRTLGSDLSGHRRCQRGRVALACMERRSFGLRGGFWPQPARNVGIGCRERKYGSCA